MTSSLEDCTLEELISKRESLMRHIVIIDEEIDKRKDESPITTIFNALTSQSDTKKSTKAKIKISTKKKKDKNQIIDEKPIRKIDAMVIDMKEALEKNLTKEQYKKLNISYKSRPQIEELIRHHNLVRVSEKIKKERKPKK